MINMLKAELFRLVKDKSFWIVIIVAAAAALLFSAMFYLLESMALSMEAELAELGMTPADVNFTAGDLIMSVIGLGNMGIFAAIAIGLYNGKDFDQNTLRNKITAGNSREAIYFSTLIVNMLMYAAIFVVLVLSAFAFGSLILGFEFYSMIGLDLLVSFIIGAAFVCIITFISFATKKSSTILVIGILSAVILTTISEYITNEYGNALGAHIYGGGPDNFAALEWISRINLFSLNTLTSLASALTEMQVSGIMGYGAYAGWLYANIAITSLVWGGGFVAGGLLLAKKTDIK